MLHKVHRRAETPREFPRLGGAIQRELLLAHRPAVCDARVEEWALIGGPPQRTAVHLGLAERILRSDSFQVDAAQSEPGLGALG